MNPLEFDVADFDGSNQAQLDAQLLVKFFYKTRPDSVKSREQGFPCFKEVEYVDIKIAGDRNGGVCRPARESDKMRFSRHYEAFKNRTEAPSEGYPLTEWAALPRSVVEQLAFLNVKTVEQLATISDDSASRIMGGNGYKKKAKQFLEGRDSKASAEELDELKKMNAQLLEEVKELRRAVASKTVKKKKTGRKPSPETLRKMAEGRKRAKERREAALKEA